MANILVIEDDLDVRRLLRDVLERAGHGVVEAADGAEGIERVRSQPVDLVITDILMPEKEGIETILELKRDWQDVKIIAISGGGRVGPDDYLKSARRVGAQRTFTKPFDPKALLQAVEELLDNPE